MFRENEISKQDEKRQMDNLALTGHHFGWQIV
jgi:hypothetical protein